MIATAAAALSDELLRLRGAVALDARLRRRRARARPARADRLRPPVRAQASRSGRCRSRSPTSTGGRSTTPHFGALAPARRGRPLGLAGRRPRRRDHRLVDPARRRLHAVLPRPPRRASGGAGLGYLLPTLCLLRARRDARALARPHRRGGAAGGGRGRRRRPRARAARADRRRDRRGVRERLLGAPSRCRTSSRACRSGSSSRRRRRSAASARSRSTWSPTRPSCSCSARSSCRCSACCSPTGCSPARALRRGRHLRARRRGGPG